MLALLVATALAAPATTATPLAVLTLDTPTLDDLSWLVGTWRGGDAPAVYEEVWQRPLANTMMGVFRYAEGEAVFMYELMTLTQAELRIKHFGGDLMSWESRKEVKAFNLVSATPTEIVFAAPKRGKRLVYTRDGASLQVRLEERLRTETFHFQRVE